MKLVDARTRFALTGTPMENHLGELWSIFDFLMPGFLFTASAFKKRFETPIVRDGDEEALHQLRRMTGPFLLRRLKKDVLKELPDKLETVLYSAMEGEQKRLYAANAARLKERLAAEDGKGFPKNGWKSLPSSCGLGRSAVSRRSVIRDTGAARQSLRRAWSCWKTARRPGIKSFCFPVYVHAGNPCKAVKKGENPLLHADGCDAQKGADAACRFVPEG